MREVEGAASRSAVVAILGGSSAFTPVLASALAGAADALPELVIRLHGRDERKLERVVRFCNLHARHRGVPHRYEAAMNVAGAARDASVIVNQMRIGGWSGRTHDDTFALRHGIPGDETIGPGGLASAVRTVPVVLRAAREAAAESPGAWFVNMTNPLGIVLAALRSVPGLRPIGLCELPTVTLERAVARVGADPGRVEADYLGVNHQGWFVRIRENGRDLLAEILSRAGDPEAAAYFGVDAAVMRRIGAVPLPYLRLYHHTEREVARIRSRPIPRGEELARLSARLVDHYRTTGDPRLPQAIHERDTAWIDRTVVPALVALLGGRACELYVSEANGRDVPGLPAEAIVEKRSRLTGEGARALPFAGESPHGEGRLRPLLDLLHEILAFERAALEAAYRPNEASVLAALLAHPLVPDESRARAMIPDVLEGVLP